MDNGIKEERASRIWYVLAALLVITICCLAASQGRWAQ